MGEGQHIEFKLRVPDGARLAKEITAFANSSGGQLLLGVDDDGEVVGVRDPMEEIFALKKVMEAHCTPPVTLILRRVRVSRKREVIVIGVPPSEDRPHLVVDPDEPPKRTAYVRVRDMSIEASREAVRLMRTRDNSDTRFEFGEKELLLMRHLDKYHRVTVEQFAQLAGVPKKQSSQTLVILTRAQILTIHYDPAEDYFTLFGIHAE